MLSLRKISKSSISIVIKCFWYLAIYCSRWKGKFKSDVEKFSSSLITKWCVFSLFLSLFSRFLRDLLNQFNAVGRNRKGSRFLSWDASFFLSRVAIRDFFVCLYFSYGKRWLKSTWWPLVMARCRFSHCKNDNLGNGRSNSCEVYVLVLDGSS